MIELGTRAGRRFRMAAPLALILVAPVIAGVVISGGPQEKSASVSNAVQVQMHGVLYHFTNDVSVDIRDLAGSLVPKEGQQLPVFDDKNSFTLHIDAAEIAMTPASLANVLNSYVFARPNAPLKKISIKVVGDRLKISGKLHNKGDVPFESEGELSATDQGKVRIHIEKVKALHLPVKGLMDLFGIDMADLVKNGKVRGVQSEKDDLILNPEEILPPPHISGHVTQVRLQPNTIVQVFGKPGSKSWPRIPGANYMAYSGNRLRFGKLTMDNTDMVLLDMDPADAFDFYLDHYQEQLTAGYTKITPQFGLRVFMRDFNKLKRAGDKSLNSRRK